MYLRSISISRWRNITELELELSPGAVVIIGRNGQGKTSLLEAIYLLGHTRSFRPARFADFLQRSTNEVAKEANVKASIQTSDGEQSVSYTITDGKRQVFINGKRITAASSFFGAVRVIEFTPDDLYLIKGSPAERRPLLDKLLAAVDPFFVDALVGYNRALRHRNILLAKADSRDLLLLRRELASFSAQLVKFGRDIADRRRKLVAELSEDVSKFYGELFSGDEGAETASASYKSSVIEDGEILSEAEMMNRFEEHFEQDLKHKSTTFGVHRDDLTLNLDTGFGRRRARQIGSQGQTRTLAIALKMAGTEFLRRNSGESPIVLLDDIESELDETRREALFDYLLKLEGQVIIATTDAKHIPKHFSGAGQLLSIKAGEVPACYASS